MFPSRVLILAGICLCAVPGLGQERPHRAPARPAAASRKSPRLTGTYTRIKCRADENQSAILEVTKISGHKLSFDLTALWWPVGRGDSPHNGEITATVALRGQSAVYENGDYRLTLRFQGHKVVLTERGSNPEFGVHVNAAGTYRRTNRAGHVDY